MHIQGKKKRGVVICGLLCERCSIVSLVPSACSFGLVGFKFCGYYCYDCLVPCVAIASLYLLLLLLLQIIIILIVTLILSLLICLLLCSR